MEMHSVDSSESRENKNNSPVEIESMASDFTALHAKS